jgi:hypothetical protein
MRGTDRNPVDDRPTAIDQPRYTLLMNKRADEIPRSFRNQQQRIGIWSSRLLLERSVAPSVAEPADPPTRSQ